MEQNMELEEIDIQRVLKQYKKRLEYERERYHTITKNDKKAMEKRRKVAREHYWRNRNKKKEYYQKNKEHLRLQRLAKEYKDRIDELKEKYPTEYSIIVDMDMFYSSSYSSSEISKS